MQNICHYVERIRRKASFNWLPGTCTIKQRGKKREENAVSLQRISKSANLHFSTCLESGVYIFWGLLFYKNVNLYLPFNQPARTRRCWKVYGDLLQKNTKNEFTSWCDSFGKAASWFHGAWTPRLLRYLLGTASGGSFFIFRDLYFMHGSVQRLFSLFDRDEPVNLLTDSKSGTDDLNNLKRFAKQPEPRLVT